MTAAEAGEHGRRAGARRLVLTHVSDELDSGRVRAEAERAFGGPVELAREGAIYDVAPPVRAPDPPIREEAGPPDPSTR